MPKRIDLTGKQFNFLRVIEYSGNTRHGEALWLCECKCGTRKNIPGSKIRKGEIKSCGCMKKELSGIANVKHGMKKTRIYRIWQGIKQRTTNPNNGEFSEYGGRGVDICVEWANSFESFKQWSFENGYSDNLTIDRINNQKGYYPENCRWITIKDNCRNKRNNLRLTLKGETKTIAEWAEITGINKATLRNRIIKMGWSAEKALTTKVGNQNKKQP
ncbi:hypothetical protein B5F07_18395 [Lachnoclostridium sp. An169]|uniref:hypothetical protein n=1 Tax=Lachnoclostridium sp. An169 TaxID=1965569 RepID=UPI000B39567A|nr:hypothetical protein [Lachnoclostridium sp. An169]OUP81209.1 hypothetical protein B5F07_18395 [Lachnoclostridium sp. An169]HJA66985.1 hypothetical protein [Candidatus Mediterraneibacter cottocaccae]